MKIEDLVPTNDRGNLTPVPSPDGKSVAFLSKREDDQLSLYRADFGAGATQPVKVAVKIRSRLGGLHGSGRAVGLKPLANAVGRRQSRLPGIV